jgi:hypothetical protein
MENELKMRSRGFSTDMSPEAVAKRLDIAGDLYDTVAWLRRFVPVNGTTPSPPDSLDTEDSGGLKHDSVA